MKTLLLALLGLVISNTALAAAPGCYALSPHFDEFGDEYFDIEHDFKISPSEEKALKKYLKSLKGTWEGKSIETNCTGPDRAPKREVTKFTTSANIAISNRAEIRFSVKKKVLGSRTMKSDIIDLLVENAVFRLENQNGVLSVAEKSRIPNRFAEYISTIERKGEKLHIELLLYINGVFVHSQVHTLTAD